jgi:hypothetical protein
MSTQPGRLPFGALTLDYPLSIGVFDTYPDAQRAVDALSDAGFPVQNCLIVGTDLRQLERVTGRLTWGRVLMGGALSGVWLGLFVGLILSLFTTSTSVFAQVVSTMLFGAVFGAVWAAIGYAATRGQRDFTSVSRIVPSKFEILTEHKVAQRAREELAKAGIGTGHPGWPGPMGTPGAGGAPAAPGVPGPTAGDSPSR